MGGWENKQVIGVKNVDALARIMAPVIFQARKADWLSVASAERLHDPILRNER